MTDAGKDGIGALLQQRGGTHGSFDRTAAIAQAIKLALRDGARIGELTAVQLEVIDHIATKLARVVNGDPSHLDNWVDILGYTELALRELRGAPKP